jgi:hypothetical protein
MKYNYNYLCARPEGLEGNESIAPLILNLNNI